MSEKLDTDRLRLDFHSHLIDYGEALPATMLRQFKSCAKALQTQLKDASSEVKLSALHEGMAKSLGFGNFYALQSALGKASRGLSGRLRTKIDWIQNNGTLVESMLPVFCFMRDAEVVSSMEPPTAFRHRFLALLASNCSMEVEAISRAYRQAIGDERGEWLLPPVILGYALPLAKVDLVEGALDETIDVLMARHCFKGKTREAVSDLLAVGLGYESWLALQDRRAERVAGTQQLPGRELELVSAIAWRIFLASGLSLPDICAAVGAGWLFSRLSVRQLYTFGRLRTEDRNRGSPGLLTRRMPGFERGPWMRESEIGQAEGEKLFIPYRAELAIDAANLCWSESSGVDGRELLKKIKREATADVEEAFLFSWATPVWPVGLTPVTYLDRDGQTFGYGWTWQEVGAFHAHVFRTKEEFLQSAHALWFRKPTHPYRCRDLPPFLTAVDFENPWDQRIMVLSGYPDPTSLDRDRGDVGTVTRVGRKRTDKSWSEVLTCKEGLVHQERDFVLDAEPWTASNRKVEWRTVEGILGLKLTPMEDIEGVHEWDWMKVKVPYALSKEEFEGMCGFVDAMERARDALVGTSATLDPVVTLDLVRLYEETTAIAKPRHSEVYEGCLEHDPHLDFEIARWGQDVLHVYPELATIGDVMCGDYALAYFGKNGDKVVRGDDRDPIFLGYCLLRNLGMDPFREAFDREWLGLLSLLLAHWKATPHCLKTDTDRLEVMRCLEVLDRAVRASRGYHDLDTSLSRSRLEFIGLAPAKVETEESL